MVQFDYLPRPIEYSYLKLLQTKQIHIFYHILEKKIPTTVYDWPDPNLSPDSGVGGPFSFCYMYHDSGAPLGFSIDGFENFVFIWKRQRKLLKFSKYWISFVFSQKLMGSRTSTSKLMGSMEPIEPMLTEPLSDGSTDSIAWCAALIPLNILMLMSS